MYIYIYKYFIYIIILYEIYIIYIKYIKYILYIYIYCIYVNPNCQDGKMFKVLPGLTIPNQRKLGGRDFHVTDLFMMKGGVRVYMA